MLQFVTAPSSRFSVAELVRMAIKGGCRWIALSHNGLDNEVDMAKIAKEIIPECREGEAFLIIDDDVELVEGLKVHGVMMHNCGRMSVAAARERLGAEAVIGVEVKSVEEAKALGGLDLDYLLVPAPADGADIVAFYASMVDALNDADIGFHVVASGDVPTESYEALLKAGVAGVAVSDAITEAENPEAATAVICDLLAEARRVAHESI